MIDDPRSQWSRYWEAMAGLMQGDFAHGQRQPPKVVPYGTFAHGMRTLSPPHAESMWDRGPSGGGRRLGSMGPARTRRRRVRLLAGEQRPVRRLRTTNAAPKDGVVPSDTGMETSRWPSSRILRRNDKGHPEEWPVPEMLYAPVRRNATDITRRCRRKTVPGPPQSAPAHRGTAATRPARMPESSASSRRLRRPSLPATCAAHADGHVLPRLSWSIKRKDRFGGRVQSFREPPDR